MGRIPQGTRKTKSGAYNRRFTVDGVRYSVTGKTAAELHQKEAEKRQQIKAGLIMSKSGLTLDGYYSDWVKQKEKSIKKQTLIVYKSIYNNHIKAGLGSRKLKDINRLDIKRHINNLHATKTACTTNRALMLLFQIFKEAKRDRVITINPVEDIQRIKEDKTETARDTIHRALTQSEIDLFFKALEGNPYETILLFMINTGVRIGEAGALNWGDVDLFNGIVKINKTISFTGDITSPKSKTSIRDIPLNEGAKEAIKKAKRNDILITGSEVLPNDTPVFLSTWGNRLTVQIIKQTIDKTTKKINADGEKIKPFSSHAMRDTFATRFIESGGNPKTLQEILGHATFSMTMDLYAHVLPDTKKSEMEKMKSVL